MDRNKIIERFVDNDLNDIIQEYHNGSFSAFARDILLFGWAGYNNLSDEELEKEYLERFEENITIGG